MLHNRKRLERELNDLVDRAALLTDHMVRAAANHDAATIQDLTWDLACVERHIDQVSFELTLINEGA
jgi:hypothetical protein